MQVVKLMEHETFFIENKFDGDRMQLHKKGSQYRYFSRRYSGVYVVCMWAMFMNHFHSSKDYTTSFGLSDQEGSFTPNIHHAFNRYYQKMRNLKIQ